MATPTRNPTDPRFVAASRVALRLAGIEQRNPRALLALLAYPRDTASWVGLVASLPWRTVPLGSDEPSIRVDMRLFATGGRRTRVRLAQAVLGVGPSREEALRGRRRQALRTNLHRAEKLGLRCAVAEDPDEWTRLDALVQRRWAAEHENFTPYAPLFGRPGQLTVAIYDDDSPLVAAGATVVGAWAQLDFFVRLGDVAEARYALHVFLLDELRRAGVQALISGPLLRLTPGLQYLHHLLGYEPTNLRVGSLAAPARPGFQAPPRKRRTGAAPP